MLNKLWQQWQGQPAPSPKPPQRPALDLESLFRQLLAAVEPTWSPGRLKGWLISHGLPEADLVAWLREFGETLLAQPQPNLASQLENLGKVGAGDLSRLAATLAKQLQPQAIMVDETKGYQHWLNQGYQQATTGDWSAALASLGQALVLNPDIGGNLDDLSSIISLSEGWDLLIALDSAHRIMNSSLLWINRGYIISKFGFHEKAIALYDHAIALDPDAPVWHNRGWSLLQLGCYEEAIESCDRALTLDPSIVLVWINRSLAASNSKVCRTSVFQSLPPAMQNLALDQRGYAGKVASLQEGFKYVVPHSEGWGKLHQALGNAHYFRGRLETQFIRSSHYYRQAVTSYHAALAVLTPEQFPQQRLEVIGILIKSLLGLGEKALASQWREAGLVLFRDSVNAAPTPAAKQRLEVQFSGFSHSAVDSLVAAGLIEVALEAAERYKNRCLTWMLAGWQDQVTSPSYGQMRALLQPGTGLVYWHLSAQTLTTFLLLPSQQAPVLVSCQDSQPFQAWLETWDKQYSDYRSKGKEDATNKTQHPWRQNLATNLAQLRTLLAIPDLEANLDASISRLILIPHRDLHRLPLHALFPGDFQGCTYLPSVQLGLNLSQRHQANELAMPSGQALPTAPLSQLPFLSIENPSNDLDYAQLESAVISQLFSQPRRFSGCQATKSVLQAELSGPYRLLHFTGHAGYKDLTLNHPVNPEDAALGLADGVFTVGDISNVLNSQTRAHPPYALVCLSACETALTTRKTLETEYVGLVSAFLRANTTHVLSTLWTVEQISNAWLMIHFYQQLLAGRPPAPALHQSQQWLRTVTYAELCDWVQALSQTESLESGAREFLWHWVRAIREDSGTMNSTVPPYAHPYYWAAFILTGRV